MRVADMRGVCTQDLREAFFEMQATASKKCTKPFFIMEICPNGGMAFPKTVTGRNKKGDVGQASSIWPAPVADEEYTMKDVYEVCKRMEEAFPELGDNARVIVEHEKAGRIHWHVTWSRIKANGKAVNFKIPPALIAARISYDMNAERGTAQPRGLVELVKRTTSTKAPTMGVMKQAARVGMNGVDLKGAIAFAWSNEKTDRTRLKDALLEKGFLLARGDKRGFVLVHLSGEVFSLSRCVKASAAEIKNVLGESKNYSDVATVKNNIRSHMKAAKKDDVFYRVAEQSWAVQAAVSDIITNREQAKLENLRSIQRAERIQAAGLSDEEQERLRVQQRWAIRSVSGIAACFRFVAAMLRRSAWASAAVLLFRSSAWQTEIAGTLSKAFGISTPRPVKIAFRTEKKAADEFKQAGPLPPPPAKPLNGLRAFKKGPIL